MRAPPSETAASAGTRDRLVEAARELFWTRGYEATGMADILRLAGVNSGSLYYFFKTKEALLVAVLEKYVEMLQPFVIGPAEAAEPDPIGRIFALLRHYRELLVLTEFRQGCPIGNLALEMSERSEPVRERVAENFTQWRRAVEGWLNDAGANLPPDLDRSELAIFILTVMEGGIMQSRAHRSIAPYDASVSVLRDYFNRLTPQAR